MALTAAQIAQLKGKSPEFQQLTQNRVPKSVAGCDDPNAEPGDICLEGACVGGQMEVSFCDHNMYCIGPYTVAC